MAKKKSSRPVGKPPYIVTPEIVEKAESLAARGLTLDQIASCLGIHISTLCEKKNEYLELAEAIKRGQNKGISIIANALYDGAKSGDKVSQIFYLKCRAHWKETNVTEHAFVPHENWLDKLK
jgi:hypothetical protein